MLENYDSVDESVDSVGLIESKTFRNRCPELYMYFKKCGATNVTSKRAPQQCIICHCVIVNSEAKRLYNHLMKECQDFNDDMKSALKQSYETFLNKARENSIGIKRKVDEMNPHDASVMCASEILLDNHYDSNHEYLEEPVNYNNVYMHPFEVREICRRQGHLLANDLNALNQTSGQAPGYAQANLVILTDKQQAFDFLLFCQRNPKPCPLIAVLEAGQYILDSSQGMGEINTLTNGLSQPKKHIIDIRTDLPKYRIYNHGILVEEVRNVSHYWQDTFYTFVIGCSFSFEDALIR